MPNWLRQLVPYLVMLSLLGNLYLAKQLYDRDRTLNLYTWGNTAISVMKYLHWAQGDITPRPDGRIGASEPQGLMLAQETLESLRSLPHFSQRVDNDDMRTLEQFLRYAKRAHALARTEQGEKGTISPESQQRLETVRKGLEAVIAHHSRFNDAKGSNPWNHSSWRAVWRDIAVRLRTIEFVPLPE